MRYFIDTEFFEDGKSIQLISIGIISENGREYYAETVGAQFLSGCSEWLKENVRPHLIGSSDVVKARTTIAKEIIEFVGDKPEFWAYYADYDWVALCQIYGTMMDLPEGWPKFCLDIKQLAWSLGNPELPKQLIGAHHALADARWNRFTFDFLMDIKRMRF